MNKQSNIKKDEHPTEMRMNNEIQAGQQEQQGKVYDPEMDKVKETAQPTAELGTPKPAWDIPNSLGDSNVRQL